MNAQTHRIVVALAAAVAAVGAMMGLTDPAGLGLTAHTWEIASNWITLVAGIIGVGATFVRALTDQSSTAPAGEGGTLNIDGAVGLLVAAVLLLAAVWLFTELFGGFTVNGR